MHTFTGHLIGFATTGFVIELALRSHHANRSDHVDGEAQPPEARDRGRLDAVDAGFFERRELTGEQRRRRKVTESLLKPPFEHSRLVELTRTWTDANGNWNPDCDLVNPAAQDLRSSGGDFCGVYSNNNFGTSRLGVEYDPALLEGIGVLRLEARALREGCGGVAGRGPGGTAGAGVSGASMTFFVNVQNLLNHTNYGTYSGVMTSPFFGRPTAVEMDYLQLRGH